MGAMKYYKKLSPSTLVLLENGDRIVFKTLDHVWGYCGTDAEYVHAQFEKFMIEQRFAISEISAEEFTRDYEDKKKAGIQPGRQWREEFGAGAVKQAVPGFAPSAAVVEGRSDIRREPAPQPTTIDAVPSGTTTVAPAAPVKEFVPQTGKRRKPAVG